MSTSTLNNPVITRPRRYPWPQSLHIWILNRYLLIELLPPLSMGLFLFASTLMLISIRDIMDVILLSGAPIGPVTKTLAAVFPLMFTVSLPIGSLLASLLVYGRLSEDRELVAMRAAGVGTLAMMSPAWALGLALTLLNVYWTSNITPKALEVMRSAQWEIVQKMTSVSWLKPGQFTPLQENLAFYFTGTTPGTNEIQRITIFMSGDSDGPATPWFGESEGGNRSNNWTVSAPRANLIPYPASGVLEIALEDCILEDLRPEKLSRVLIEHATITIDIGMRLARMMQTFTKEQRSWSELKAQAEQARVRYEDLRHHLGFPEGAPHGEVLEKAEEWMEVEQQRPGSSPLAGGMFDLRSVEQSIEEYQTSINRAMLRIAYPTATFLFMMIGTALGVLMGRGNRSVCIVVTVGVLMFYYSVQKIVEGISEDYALTSQFDPGLMIWIPNLLLLLLGLILSFLASRN